MSFPVYLDENVNTRVAALLQQAGFDAISTKDAGRANRGESDEEQLAFTTTQGRAIFTHNAKDFARIATAWAEGERHHSGIIYSSVSPVQRLVRGLQRLPDLYPDGIPDLYLPLPLSSP